MKKWKSSTKNEKWMVVLIVLLVLAILTRWGYVRRQVAESFAPYFGTESQ